MPLNYPDILQHNNSVYPIVDSNNILGSVFVTGSDTEQYGISEYKRKLGMIVYFSSSQDFKYYKGGTTSSGDWGTAANWGVLGGNSVNTGSLLLTASVASNTITFTKGNGDTFPITVETGSGALAAANFTASFDNQSTWTINHNLDYKYVLVQIFDSNDNQIIPEEITLVNNNTAQATFNSGVSGKAVVTVGGTTLNTTLPAGSSTQIQYNNGGAFGASNNFTFDGTSVILLNLDQSAYALSTGDSKFYTTTEIFNNRTPGENFIQDFIINKIQTGEKFPFGTTSATQYDLVCLSVTTWAPVDQADNTKATQLLAIYDGTQYITEGYITVGVNGSTSGVPTISGTIAEGKPVYITEAATSAPFLSTDKPTTGIVRILGHLLYKQGDYYLMRFRPDHTWVEIATP